MDLQLTDKLALVSGSTKGIGLAIATGLAREGVNVIINGRCEESIDAALAKIRETLPSAKLGGFAGDLANATVVEKLVNNFPTVDIPQLPNRQVNQVVFVQNGTPPVAGQNNTPSSETESATAPAH